ncbi:MAG: ACT domain-containing protein [bacterium]|nr:ACT domain-containing protein [bacterium]
MPSWRASPCRRRRRALWVATSRRWTEMTLDVLPDRYAIARFPADHDTSTLLRGAFHSVTHTVDETSVVCDESSVPENARVERGWRALRVRGTLEFSQVGVLSGLAHPLREAGISIFVVSTFDTDYLFVLQVDLQRAVEALQEAGHEIASSDRDR